MAWIFSIINEITMPARKQKKWFFENEKLMKFFEFFEKFVFIVGIPLSIFTYYSTNEKERKEREFTEYNKLDEEYWTYEAMCTKIPLLGVSDATQADTSLAKYIIADSLLSPEQKVVQRQMMGLSISMYERAYLMYCDESSALKTLEWEGWAIH
jgi:hypothetical protein